MQAHATAPCPKCIETGWPQPQRLLIPEAEMYFHGRRHLRIEVVAVPLPTSLLQERRKVVYIGPSVIRLVSSCQESIKSRLMRRRRNVNIQIVLHPKGEIVDEIRHMSKAF